MKVSLWMCGLLTMAALSGSSVKAQAPAGATGQCKDGTYSTAASKSGACSGHKGVQAWYAQTAAPSKSNAGMPQKSPAVPAAPAAPAPAQARPQAAVPAPTQAAVPAPTQAAVPAGPAAPKTARASTATMAQAPGGGPGMVWVNTKSKVYHCSTDAYYGKTKAGKYLTEDAAKGEGDRPDNNKPCAK